jgi:hypothetical protein
MRFRWSSTVLTPRLTPISLIREVPPRVRAGERSGRILTGRLPRTPRNQRVARGRSLVALVFHDDHVFPTTHHPDNDEASGLSL